MKRLFILFNLLFFVSSILGLTNPSVSSDCIIIQGLESKVIIEDLPPSCSDCYVLMGKKEIALKKEEESYSFIHQFDKSEEFVITNLNSKKNYSLKVTPIPLWLSIIPPLIAILLALVFKEVVTSLLIGIFSGAFIINYYSSGFLSGILHGFTSSIDHYILTSLNDEGHLSIILFSMLIGGMVSVISKNGGMQGVVNRISKYAKDAKSGQLATWFLGIIIFFDGLCEHVNCWEYNETSYRSTKNIKRKVSIPC